MKTSLGPIFKKLLDFLNVFLFIVLMREQSQILPLCDHKSSISYTYSLIYSFNKYCTKHRQPAPASLLLCNFLFLLSPLDQSPKEGKPLSCLTHPRPYPQGFHGSEAIFLLMPASELIVSLPCYIFLHTTITSHILLSYMSIYLSLLECQFHEGSFVCSWIPKT